MIILGGLGLLALGWLAGIGTALLIGTRYQRKQRTRQRALVEAAMTKVQTEFVEALTEAAATATGKLSIPQGYTQ